MIHDDDDDDETSDKATPFKCTMPDVAKTPRRLPLAVVPRRPPPGRPSASVSLSELAERITRDVQSTTSGELERRHDDLRAELAGGVRIATSMGVAAIVMNVVVILALVVIKSASARVLPAAGVCLAVVAMTAVTGMFFSAAKAGLRRPQSAR